MSCTVKELLKLCPDFVGALGLAFPDFQYTPSEIQQCLAVAGVSQLIRVELRIPEVNSRLGHCGQATRVPVPEHP